VRLGARELAELGRTELCQYGVAINPRLVPGLDGESRGVIEVDVPEGAIAIELRAGVLNQSAAQIHAVVELRCYHGL
jgi:hypothetical protein